MEVGRGQIVEGKREVGGGVGSLLPPHPSLDGLREGGRWEAVQVGGVVGPGAEGGGASEEELGVVKLNMLEEKMNPLLS